MMDQYWIWLTTLPQIGAVTANRLLQHFSTPKDIFDADQNALLSVKQLTSRQRESILQHHDLEQAKRIEEQCFKKNIFLLPQSDPSYPENTRQIEESPPLLYCKGTLKPFQEGIAIIGARRCTQEDKYTAATLTEKYTTSSSAIISGMAKGIDSYAHTACLKKGGYTIAVLGNGLDTCYPSEHNHLMECIEQTGLLLSEYPPGTRPSRYTFPRRNRIISAWCDRLFVISPTSKSGTLITADYAYKYHREVTILKGDR